MSTTDRLLLILHIGFAIFTLGPLTAATMASPRCIRKQNVVVLRYLNRTTRIYGLGTLGIFLFGLLLSENFAKFWLSASITLFVVALVLLMLIEHDQRKSAHKLEVAAAKAAPPVAEQAGPGEKTGVDEKAAGAEEKEPSAAEAAAEAEAPAPGEEIAMVERGRISAISGVVALIWLVILVLMVFRP